MCVCVMVGGVLKTLRLQSMELESRCSFCLKHLVVSEVYGSF